jgi:response regulator NasT
MKERLRIAVADDEADMREFFREALGRLGHDVVAECGNGRELLDACRRLRPDCVITDVKMPDMDGIEAAGAIWREDPLPIIIVSAYCDAAFIERAEESHVLAYLLKPIRESNLEPAIQIARRRFAEFRTLERETSDLRQALADRKVIERAKGLVMRQSGLDEEAAFRKLQKLASGRNLKLADLARLLLEAAGLQ